MKNSAKRNLKGVPRVLVAAILLSLCFAQTSPELPAQAQGEMAVIGLGQGIEFYQVDFEFAEITLADSNWGRLTADPVLLVEYTGITEGVLNVFTDYGWVVQNLPLSATEGLGPITTYFNLGLPTLSQDVAVLSAYVSYSAEPYLDLQEGVQTEYPVGTVVWNAEGVGEATTEIGAAPPLYTGLVSLEPSVRYTLPNPVNVEAAVNQCFPMAIANSLQYLEKTYRLNVPHDHVPGIGVAGDNSLVGHLDREAGRWVTSRHNGSGVMIPQMLKGKFSYLAKNGLKDKVVHRHQGQGFGFSGGNFTSSGITSIDDGSVVTWEWICEQIKNGEDVELVFSFPWGGGHAVRVFECASMCGIKYVSYLHDRNQSNDADGLELVRDVEVRDMDGDGLLNLGSIDWEIRFVLSESVESAVKPDLKGVHATHNLLRDKVVVMHVRVVDNNYSGKIYDIEILPQAQNPSWDSVEGIEAPEGWEFEQIGDGVRFYTKTKPLITCQRTKFVFRVRARRISCYIRIHMTGKDHENLGEIVSKRLWWWLRLWFFSPFPT